MNDLLLHQLGKALYLLECEGGSLEDLLYPQQSSARGSITRQAARRGSTPPVNLSMLDLKMSIEGTLLFWVAQLASDVVGAPVSRTIVDSARWLQAHISGIDDAPWGELAAQEIIAQAHLVADVVSDPAGSDAPEMVRQGSCRVVAAQARSAGVPVSKSTIHRWAVTGEIPSSVGSSGEVIVQLDDVLARARLLGDQRGVDVGHPVM